MTEQEIADKIKQELKRLHEEYPDVVFDDDLALENIWHCNSIAEGVEFLENTIKFERTYKATEKTILGIIEKECPKMATHKNLIHNLVTIQCDYSDDSRKNAKKMQKLTDEEYKCFCDIRDILDAATVEQVIYYLQANFKLDDKLCYMDCIEGFKNDCTYVTKDQLGKRFFYYVKDLKNKVLNETGSISKKDLDDKYPYVQDDDVVVA